MTFYVSVNFSGVVRRKNIIYESPLKIPSSKLPTFCFKIGQLVEFDHKKDETKNISQFFINLKQVLKNRRLPDFISPDKPHKSGFTVR